MFTCDPPGGDLWGLLILLGGVALFAVRCTGWDRVIPGLGEKDQEKLRKFFAPSKEQAALAS